MSATSLPSSMPSAVALSTDKVMGMGQNTPSAMRMSSHTPRQSSLAHEAGQRREAAYTHHDHIARLPGAQLDGRERYGAGALRFEDRRPRGAAAGDWRNRVG